MSDIVIDNQTGEIVPVERPALSLGSLPIDTPAKMVKTAIKVANQLAPIIEDKKLYKVIKGRKHVYVEGWTTLGAMLGVIPREIVEYTNRRDDGSYEAAVELVRVFDGAIVGRASSSCGGDEWNDRNEYARRSMAITRATGKAFRLSFSWIMTLAGYEVTPAEEMDFDKHQPLEREVPQTSAARNGNDEGYVDSHSPQAPAQASVHWILDAKTRAGFWAWTKEQGATHAQVHEALGVQSLKEYIGTLGAAKEGVQAYMNGLRQVLTDDERLEAAHAHEILYPDQDD